MSDPVIVFSPLSGTFTNDGVSVDVRISCVDKTRWTLEVATADGIWTVWEELFPTDVAAHEEFLQTVRDESMSVFLRDEADIIH